MLLGDETTLGLFACLSASAPGRCIGALEVADGAQGSPAWPSLIGLELPAVQRTGARGDALVRWIETNDIARSHDVCFYLAGHTGSIVQIREHLLHRGWPKRNTVPRRTGRMASEGSEKIPSDGRSPAAMGAHRARLSSR